MTNNISIRAYEDSDKKKVFEIYDNASKRAHHFLSDKERSKQRRSMEKTLPLPNCETFVVERYGHVVGFASVIDGDKLAAIFVKPGSQRKGIGKALMNHLKESQENVNLAVYVKNYDAVRFYEGQGFEKSESKLDQETKQQYVEMNWKKDLEEVEE